MIRLRKKDHVWVATFAPLKQHGTGYSRIQAIRNLIVDTWMYLVVAYQMGTLKKVIQYHARRMWRQKQ